MADITGSLAMPKKAKSLTSRRDVEILIGPRCLKGEVSTSPDARALVIFAHGSGSSRLSPRNQFVASVLQEAGLATLLVDLLDEDEAHDRSLIFDVELLAERLRLIRAWSNNQEETHPLRIGYFGASTGAAAALLAASLQPQEIGAVVSRGGRPDLAETRLPMVQAPTLLIVGGHDDEVLELNRQSYYKLGGIKELAVVPGATHLFMEPGALEQVADLASQWFRNYLLVDRGGGAIAQDSALR
jgi:putative phosphoribosyl transferase